MSSTNTSPATSTRITSPEISRTSQTFVSSTSDLPATHTSPTTSASRSASDRSSTSDSSTSSSSSGTTFSSPTPMSSGSSPASTSRATASSTDPISVSTPASSSKPTSTRMSTSTRPTSSPPTSSSSPPQSSQSSSPPTSRLPSTSHSSSTPPSSSSHSTSSSPADSSTQSSTSDLPSSSSLNTPANTSASPSNRPTSNSEPTRPGSTLQTTNFITTTNSRGETTTSAPAIVTEIFTSTASDGSLVTQTSVIANPTLSPNNGSSGSTFFRNTGAVAGVFVLVGLAVTAICLWIFFAVRRRRRTQKIERDTAVSASLAAAGFKRTDLDDDDLNFGRHSRVTSADLEMGQRSASGLGRSDNGDGFDPYVGYVTASQDVRGGAREGGYIQAGPSSPTLPFLGMGAYLDEGHLSDSEDSRRDRRISGTGHLSGGSYEPLLAAYTKSSPSPKNGNDDRPPTPPPRNPLRMLHGSQPGSPSGTPALDLNRSSPNVTPTNQRRASSEYSSESADHDDRLDPGLIRRVRTGSIGGSTTDLRDDEDYSRPVLAVRNMTTLTDASSSVHSPS